MSGSLHLIGGGWGGDGSVWRGFLDAATRRAGGGTPAIAVVVVRGTDGRSHASKLVQALGASGAFEPVVLLGSHGGPLEEVPRDVDGVLVGGGVTPAYLDAIEPQSDRLRALVADGVPYAGFSAGSAIAAERALVGGWLAGGRPVLAEEASEELGPLTVRDGLGLLPVTVDVHAAQWGTLSRLVAAADTGLVDWGVAIDEDTALVVADGQEHVEGAGHAWWVEHDDGLVSVHREAGAEGPRVPRPLRRQR